MIPHQQPLAGYTLALTPREAPLLLFRDPPAGVGLQLAVEVLDLTSPSRGSMTGIPLSRVIAQHAQFVAVAV